MLEQSQTQTKFVVLTTQRSGSTWLIGLLNQLDRTTACDELFLNRKRKLGQKYWDSDFAYPRFVEMEQKGIFKHRPISVFSYLNKLYEEPGSVGFKLMYSQLKAQPEILPYLMYKKISVIHLVRQNYLDIIISHQVKNCTGRAHVLPGEKIPEKILIDLEPQTLVSNLQQLKQKHDWFRKLLKYCHLRHIEVVYEELVRDPSKFNQLWDFLALDSHGSMPQSKLVKIRRGGHADVIRNYQEVKAVLMDSAFATLID